MHDQIQNKLSLDFKLLGEQTYKNIAKPVRTYTINEGAAAVTPARQKGWRVPVAVIAAVLAIAGAGYWGYRQYDANRTEQRQVEARLAAQKQAAEQAQQAAEEAKREMQLQAQKQAAEEELRRAQEERDRVEQDRKLLEAEKRAADAAKKQAADEALRRAQEERAQLEQDRKQLKAEKAAAEAAKRQAADEAQHSAQEEHNQLEQERKRIEAEKQSAETDMKQATASQHCDARSHDKRYAKLPALTRRHLQRTALQLVHIPRRQRPACWPLALVVRNGIAEGNWISKSMKPCKGVRNRQRRRLGPVEPGVLDTEWPSGQSGPDRPHRRRRYHRFRKMEPRRQVKFLETGTGLPDKTTGLFYALKPEMP